VTHSELCSLAVRWLKRPNSAKGHGCIVAVSECRAEMDGECPDAIGFRAGWHEGSVLVECKVSRADFLADKAKPHRRAGAGMGTWRYYMAPTGVIRAEDLPERWGLLEVNARGHITPVAGPAATMVDGGHSEIIASLEKYRHEKTDISRERALLVRLLARLGDIEAMNLRIREAEASRNRLAAKLEKMEIRERSRVHAAWAETLVEAQQAAKDGAE